MRVVETKYYELNLMLEIRMRMVSIRTILNEQIILNERTVFNVRTVLNIEKKSLLLPGITSQGHDDCGFKRGQLKMIPSSGLSHLVQT